MIYYYDVKLAYFKNNVKIIKDYVVSFCDLVNFLVEKKKKNGSMVIYSIKPHYSIYKF